MENIFILDRGIYLHCKYHIYMIIIFLLDQEFKNVHAVIMVF